MTDTSKTTLFDSNGDWLCHWIETAHFDRAVWLNMAAYFSATWVFGSPGWKCAVIALTVGLLSKMQYGRGILTKLGVVVALLTLVEWSEILPPAKQMATQLALLITRHAA
jgi:hypothetical protein